LNWTYPNALYVRTALWQAESAGILPKRQAQPMPPALTFRREALSLRMLADRLSGARSCHCTPMNIAVVMIDSMLWTRFVAGPTSYVAQVDVRGPESGDVVVVTTSKVVETMGSGSLDASAAEAHGLIRFYWRPESHNNLRRLLGSATAKDVIANPTAGRTREEAEASAQVMLRHGDRYR